MLSRLLMGLVRSWIKLLLLMRLQSLPEELVCDEMECERKKKRKLKLHSLRWKWTIGWETVCSGLVFILVQSKIFSMLRLLQITIGLPQNRPFISRSFFVRPDFWCYLLFIVSSVIPCLITFLVLDSRRQ